MEMFYKFTLNIQKIQLKEWKKKLRPPLKACLPSLYWMKKKYPTSDINFSKQTENISFLNLECS